MAESFEKVLAEAKSLSPEERQKLIRELSQPSPPANGEQEQRSLYDALNARGLIGCLKDAPPDLSTNPKYMEGFGQHDR
jgi:hypothetical protein